MAERRQCEFFLVRYVPDPVKNEFVNIGVMMREAGRPETATVKLTRDWSRVRCVDAEADIAMLESLERELRERGATADGMRVLEESLSNAVQLTEGKAYLAESVVDGVEQLSAMYVEARKQPRERKRSGRAALLMEMRSAFERAGVWDLMRKRINASLYTRDGDPLRIDCGYRPNGVVRMFHAVSLEGDLEAAKVLAFGREELSAGVLRVEKASLELTAIVEPLRESRLDEADVAQYRFGVETMERSLIRVLTVADLERVGEVARRELRVG
jgi:hypothetical protein